jgi:hypothetical protein
MTNLNTPVIIVRSPMGRDIAAFADPEHAWTWVDEVYDLRAHTIYVRPDGETARHAHYPKAKMIEWAINWEK